MLSAVWEEPEVAAEAKRPRRRLYRVTAAGAAALAAARRGQQPTHVLRATNGLA